MGYCDGNENVERKKRQLLDKSYIEIHGDSGTSLKKGEFVIYEIPNDPTTFSKETKLAIRWEEKY